MGYSIEVMAIGTCEACGSVLEVPLSWHPNFESIEEEAAKDVQELGWVDTDHDGFLCPDCLQELELEDDDSETDDELNDN